MQKRNHEKVRRMVVIAMFAAMAYAAMLVIHIKVGFLTMDVKDTIITLCGLYFGPLSALIISLVVPLLEFVTISDTAHYGLIMNILGSVSFSVTASLIYKWKKTFWGAITALATAACVVTGVMVLANLFITPHFMGTTTAQVRSMIPTLLLPFNLLKAIINVGLVLLLYKHLGNALRKAGFLPRRARAVQADAAGEPCNARRVHLRTVAVTVVAALLVAGAITVIFLVLGGKFDFGL